MEIWDAKGNKVLDSVVTQNAEHVEELMQADYVSLQWVSNVKRVLPSGAYIVPFDDGVRYMLLDPHTPDQKNTDEFTYSPQFQHPKMYLGKVPYTRASKDTEGNDIKLLDWDYKGYLTTFLSDLCDFITRTFTDEGITSDKFSYSILGEIEGNVTISISNNDILSVLNNLCNTLDCEWHIDWEQRRLFVGNVRFDKNEGETLVLTSGVNVGMASVSSQTGTYYNVYLPQGSTRNMAAATSDGSYYATNRRLELDPKKYPDGMIYTDGEGNIVTKEQFLETGLPKMVQTLVLDEIYPKIDLYAYNIRSRERYLLDDNEEKVIDHYDGETPVYKRYAIWYMRLAYPIYNADGTIRSWKDATLGDTFKLISGYTLMCSFGANANGALTSPLAGREFELNYVETVNEARELSAKADPDEGDTGVTVKKGDFEIIYTTEGNLIIPTTEEQGLVPKGEDYQSVNGNKVVIFNVVMGEDFIKAARGDLEVAALREIKKQHSDLNQYTFNSDNVSFKKDMPSLYIGRSVTYNDGVGNTLDTRIMKLTTKLDFPFMVEITVGNKVLKGSTSQLKTDVQMILSGNHQTASNEITESVVRSLIRAFGAANFLSKVLPDTANGVITFMQGLIAKAKSIFKEGIEIGNFVTGWLGGSGAAIDKDGNAEFESIKARGFIETPELRFNRIDVVSGELWNSVCFGTIERVDTDRRLVWLKLEDGELSGIHVNDICRGIFHSINGNNPIKERLDDCNFIELAGFATSYFTPTVVYDNGASFKYSLKPGTTVHPQVGMKFAVYGNFTDKSRQASAYQTRTYQRYLNKVDTWVIDPGKNIYMQLGLLDGLTISGYQLKDYGALMHNVYLSGVHIDFDRDFLESITPDVYAMHLTRSNFIVITDLEGNIIDGLKETDNVTANDDGEAANVTANTVGGDDFDNVTVGNVYLMRSTIQAYNGDTQLLYSDHIEEGMFVAELDAHGCKAVADNGIVTITDIDTSAESIYVDVRINCEGNVHLTKRIDISVIVEPENGVTADLDNEMTSLPSDDKGNVFAFSPVKVVPRLWYGNDPMVITRAYVEKLPDGITTNVKLVTESGYSYYDIPFVDGVRTLIISGVSKSAADVNELLICVEGKINSRATNTYTKSTVFKLNKVKMGENAIRYELVPSTNEIIVDKDGNVKTSAVSCQVIELDGKGTATLTTSAQLSARNLTMKVCIYNASATGSEVGYTIGSNVSIGSTYGGQAFTKDTLKAVFTLYHNGTLIDKEGVPVIRNGVYSVRLDLDNENDSMLYNGNGVLISGNVVSHATLFDGVTNVNSAVTEWSRLGSTGCDATVSNNTITVTAMSANTGSVTIGAKYLGNIYTAQLTLKKLVGVDKYEIVTTPTSVTKDPNTGKYSHTSITVDVYVTRQNGTREKNPNMGGATLSNNITGGMTPGGIFQTSSFGTNKQVVFTVTRNGAVEDSETVPLLEAGLNGKKRVVIQPVGGGTRSYTYAQWNSWGAYGHSENWGCSNVNEVVVGDTGVIAGYVSDRGNISATIEGIVTSKGTDTVAMTSLVLTMKGDNGKDAEYDVIEVVSNTLHIGLLSELTGSISFRAIHIKGSTRTTVTAGESSHKFYYYTYDNNNIKQVELTGNYHSGGVATRNFDLLNGVRSATDYVTLKYKSSSGDTVLQVPVASAGESYFPNYRGLLVQNENKTIAYNYAQNSEGVWMRDYGIFPINDVYYYYQMKQRGHTTLLPTDEGGKDWWEQMSQYKAVLAETLIGKNCNIGGFLVSDECLVSVSEVTNPKSDSIYDKRNIVLNGKYGRFVANDCKIRGEVNATSGTFENCKITNNCSIEPSNEKEGGWFLRGGKDSNGDDKGAAAWWLGYEGNSWGQFTMESRKLDGTNHPPSIHLSMKTAAIVDGSDSDYYDTDGYFFGLTSNRIKTPKLASIGAMHGVSLHLLEKMERGITFYTNSGTDIAFCGSGHGVLNGVIQGYKLNTISSGTIKIANGNTVYCSGKNTSVYLPELAECQNVLGTKGAFALDLYIIAAKGAYKYVVYGGKANSSAPSTSADLVSNDHGSMSITMSEGDVLNLKLIYNGSTFCAYIVSHFG